MKQVVITSKGSGHGTIVTVDGIVIDGVNAIQMSIPEQGVPSIWLLRKGNLESAEHMELHGFRGAIVMQGEADEML